MNLKGKENKHVTVELVQDAEVYFQMYILLQK